MIKSTVFFLKEKLKVIKYYKFMPSQLRSDDLYIVEYPKSGITWLSTIISNINLLISEKEQFSTYYNIQQLIPDIHMNRFIPLEPVWTKPNCRIIKSHYEWCPYYNHVIYLVRNPVSVMNSYYHYSRMLGNFSKDIEHFVKDKNFGISRWKAHVESWLFRGESSQRIHLIKYEELIDSPIMTIINLYKNLGFELSETVVKKAIDRSSFEKMKEQENFYKSFNPNSSLIFMREGKSSVKLDGKLEKYILENTKEIREYLGY